MDPEFATQEVYELVREHHKRFGPIVCLYFCPNDAAYVVKRLREALETGIPYDSEKEFLDSSSQWFRDKYRKGEIII